MGHIGPGWKQGANDARIGQSITGSDGKISKETAINPQHFPMVGVLLLSGLATVTPELGTTGPAAANRADIGQVERIEKRAEASFAEQVRRL